MFERFTNQSRRVVVLAQEEARAFNHSYIGSEHILLGLMCEGKGTGARALQSMDVTLDAARQKLEEITGRGQHAPPGHIPFTPRAKKVLELSLSESRRLGDQYIGTGHILLGIMREGDGVAVQMLVSLGKDLNVLRERVTRELADHAEQGQDVPDLLSRAQLRVRPRRRDEIWGLLDTIDERLSVIEQRLGITQAVPDELRILDERIAEVRRDKEAAVDVQDFARAAELRGTEKQLLSERERVERESEERERGEREAEADRGEGADEGEGAQASAGAEASTGAEASAGEVPETGADVEIDKILETGEDAGESDELAWLRARLTRLEAQLREHNIEPAEPQDPPAATG